MLIVHNKPFLFLVRYAVPAAMLVLLHAGCVRGGTAIEPAPSATLQPVEDASAEAVLRGLAERQQALEQFEARGVFVFRSEASAAAFAGRGFVRYEAPDKLAIDARHRASGTLALRLRADGGDAYMLYGAPGERHEALWEEGLRTYGEDMAVSPADIVRELFFPEDWLQASGEARVVSPYDAADGTITMQLERSEYVREIVVSGPPWVLRESRLYTNDGAVQTLLAESVYAAYEDVSGILFPVELRGAFFGEPAASIECRLNRTPTVNEPLPEDSFTVPGLEYDAR